MTLELSPATLELTNPRRRLVMAPHRRVDAAYAVASAIGTLTGDFDVDYISAFNSRADWFSDDGSTLPNSHGARLSAGDQIGAVVDLLRADPSSRRAMATVYSFEDLRSASRDIPCVTSLHFLRRDERLTCIVNMRSQSAVMVFPYDVYAFTFIQEAVASELHLELGRYHHVCNSYHIYDDELAMASGFATEAFPDPLEMPRMPVGGALRYARSVQDNFKALHNMSGSTNIGRGDIARLDLPEYWASLLCLMLVGAARLRGGDHPDIVDLIDNEHKARLRPAVGR